MIKHCTYCDDYGEVDKSKCGCGAECELCPVCKGDSNPRIKIKYIEDQVDRLEKNIHAIMISLGITVTS